MMHAGRFWEAECLKSGKGSSSCSLSQTNTPLCCLFLFQHSLLLLSEHVVETTRTLENRNFTGDEWISAGSSVAGLPAAAARPYRHETVGHAPDMSRMP